MRFFSWKIVVLVAGSAAVLGLGVLAGEIIGAGRNRQAAAASSGGQASFAAGQPTPAAGPAQAKSGGLPGAGRAGYVAQDLAKRRVSRTSMKLGGQAYGVANTGITATQQSLQRTLPPFLAEDVPGVFGLIRTSARQQSIGAAQGLGKMVTGGAAGVAAGGAASRPAAGGTAAESAAARSEGPGREEVDEPEVAKVDEEDNNTSDEAASADAAPLVLWSVQLGRFARVANADDFAGDMARRGVNTRQVVETGGDGWTWYSVRTGLYPGQGAAQAALDKLRRRGFSGTVISEGRGDVGDAIP